MKVIAIPPLILASISFAAGLYHLLVYSQQTEEKKNLSFALACLSVGLYDVFASGVYQSSSVVEAAPWQRGEVIAMMLFGVTCMWFVADYTDYASQTSKKRLYLFSGYFLIAAFVHLVDRSELTWLSVDTPSIKEITLLNGFEITYYEMAPGPFTDFQSILSLPIFVFVVWMGVRYFRQGYRREAIPLLVSLGCFWLGIFNDTFVSSGLYEFIYLLEYAFLAMVLLMAISLARQVALVAQALRESEERYRVHFENVTDVIYSIDSQYRILDISPAVERLLMYKPEELKGKTIQEVNVLSPDFVEAALSDMKRIFAGEDIAGSVYEFVAKDGTRRFGEVRANPLTHDGEIGAFFAVARDITERRRMEMELQEYRQQLEQRVKDRTAELEEANRQLMALAQVKDEFVSSVSHELRTPIANLKLQHLLLARNPEKAEKHLNVAKRETERLARIIDELLHLSRLDQDQVDFALEPVNLCELAEQYVTDRANLAAEQGLALFLEKLPGVPLVAIDEGLIGQVLSIILTNALNYTPGGGQVVVRIRAEQRDGKQRAGFCVCDTGPGISPEDQQHLLERFYRGEVGRGSGTPGTGLGLAIAQEIVERHDGEIEIESVPGEGATFTVWLPAMPPG